MESKRIPTSQEIERNRQQYARDSRVFFLSQKRMAIVENANYVGISKDGQFSIQLDYTEDQKNKLAFIDQELERIQAEYKSLLNSI